MKVIATDTGYTKEGRVKAGTVFEVPDGTTGRWFVPVSHGSEESSKVVLSGRNPRARSTPQSIKKGRIKRPPTIPQVDFSAPPYEVVEDDPEAEEQSG